MKKNYLFLYIPILIGIVQISFAQAPAIQWQKSLGGSSQDLANSIQATPDGGYIIAGRSSSNNGDVSGNHGDLDYWVVKIDGGGNIQWQKSYGGSGFDEASFILSISDGGYIIVGHSFSNNGDVSGNHGSADCWVLKIDGTGIIQWQKSLGGSAFDKANSIQVTSDGGYIIAGRSSSNNGDVSGNHGDSDYWIVKISGLGNIQWQKSFGGSSFDEANSVQATSDDGYIVSGYSQSNNGDVSGNHGQLDFWIVKIDGTGNIQWQKSFGGSQSDYAYSIDLTSDGGYILAGTSYSSDGDATVNHGTADFWIVKIDGTGNIQWQKSFGGSFEEESYSIKKTNEGGYVIAGFTRSNNGDVSGSHGDLDFWIVKINNSGIIEWQKCLGGGGYDYAYSILQNADGSYIIAGRSTSNNGDVSGNHGDMDFWVVKLQSANSINTGALASPQCTGTIINIPFTAIGAYAAGNIFTAQLSNSLGSFASPTNIGSLASTTSGTINTTIPISIPIGSGYRIRVVSSNPNIIGTDNGNNITINAGTLYFADTDGDGYGNAEVSIYACTAQSGYVSNSTDCNDGNSNIHPGATETCNEVDDDCDGLIDEEVQIVATCSNNNPSLYFGAPGNQTSTIKAIASGGVPPYTISITMNRPLNCNVFTNSGDEVWTSVGGTSTNNICPLTGPGLIPVSTGTVAGSGGYYSVNVTLMEDAIFTATVTDANGCVSTCTTSIHAEDVRCFAGNSGIAKVVLCHQTGSPNNPCVKICVDESAVAAHLAHGDFLGNCTPNCVAPVFNSRASETILESEANPIDMLQVNVWPNPSEHQFTLLVESSSDEKFVMVVYDVLGRKVKRIEKSIGQLVRFGEDIKAGVYIVEVIQGVNRKTIKLVKQ